MNPYFAAQRLDDCDREALMNAELALQGPQAAMQVIHALIVKRYGIGPLDTFSTDGTINRVKPDAVSSAVSEPLAQVPGAE